MDNIFRDKLLLLNFNSEILEFTGESGGDGYGTFNAANYPG